MTGALIVRGSAFRIPLRDGSVDLVVTSPGYWALRDYGTGHPSEIGSESHWRDWLARMVTATAEMARVLKPSGSIFVNLGDKYSTHIGTTSGHKGNRQVALNPWSEQRQDDFDRMAVPASNQTGIPEKSLLLLPERYRIACVDQLGLTARAVIVWDKPNGLPESVRDRVRRSHEDWVHLTLGPRYYSATDELREPHQWPNHHQLDTERPRGNRRSLPPRGPSDLEPHVFGLNPLGKLPGSVWSIASEPLRIPAKVARALNLPDHYAAFGSEWPRRLILGWSPPGICVACGQGRFPVVEREVREPRNAHDAPSRYVEHGYKDGIKHGHGASSLRQEREATILGYACACTPSTLHPGTGSPPRDLTVKMPGTIPRASDQNGGRKQAGDYERVGPWREYHLDGWQAPPTRPAVVLDPFAGTFTTVMVARALDRIGIGIDLSAAYCRLGSWRVWHSGHAAKATSRTNQERQGQLL